LSSIDSAALLIVGTFAAGLLLGGFVFQATVGRARTARILEHAASLADPRPDASRPRPLRDREAAAVLERIGARLARVESLATTDQLTGVMNRPAALRHLAAEVERSVRHGRPVTVALADIDHFKQVNDTYGHLAGDLVLRQVAQVLRSNVRANDAIGRYGGEEFLLIFAETDIDAGTAVAEKLRRLVGRTEVRLPDGTQLSVTISVGVSAGSGPELRLDQISQEADSALYAAKSLGRDQVYVFRGLSDDRMVGRTPITPAAREEAALVGRLAADAAEGRLSEILSPRPGWAGRPSELIAELSVHVASVLGLPDGEVRRVRTASLLHDVGKLAIPEELLSKPTQLSESEWRSVMEHPKIGQIILEQAGAIRDASTIALHHHEWFNGQGYPHGLSGTDIPVGARIVALADAYEAMTSWRPYKRTKTHEEALAELQRCAGTQFDPDLVELFVSQFPAELIRDSGDLRTGTDG
jgi:diguanylate cyclase (GGDEF)-like protein